VVAGAVTRVLVAPANVPVVSIGFVTCMQYFDAPDTVDQL
jgi:hypothetical protein